MLSAHINAAPTTNNTTTAATDIEAQIVQRDVPVKYLGFWASKPKKITPENAEKVLNTVQAAEVTLNKRIDTADAIMAYTPIISAFALATILIVQEYINNFDLEDKDGKVFNNTMIAFSKFIPLLAGCICTLAEKARNNAISHKKQAQNTRSTVRNLQRDNPNFSQTPNSNHSPAPELEDGLRKSPPRDLYEEGSDKLLLNQSRP